MTQRKITIAGVPFYEEELKMLKRSTGSTAEDDPFIKLLEDVMSGDNPEGKGN